MTTIDDRVVAMSFENKRFEQGVGQTLSSIDRLKNALNFQGAGKGLDGLNAAARKTDLSHISNSVDQIKNKFSALNAAATATIFNITNRAINAGTQMAKSFTVSPVLDGLHEYENQLNAVQTILGNTKDAGTNLKDVNEALDQLNQYADKTIYNFGQMTKNVGTFTAAGVDLETSVASIKGISNLAALSGSSAEQASTAMYQLSQAISAGRVGLQDWNSVVNAGMGGAVFQKALMRTAENMGALKDGAVEIDKATGKATVNGKSFRESIMAKPGEKSWLTGDVLTNTLKQLSGDMTTAQLKAEGYSDAQIKAIQTQSKMALDAATKVKTLSQLLDTTKEAIGSGWASTWEIVFGDFGEAKKLFTGLSQAIGGFVGKSADARNRVLKDWKDLGGRTLLIKSLKEAFHNLGEIIAPIRKAFRDIFPAKTGKDLFRFTESFSRLVKALKPSTETVENLRRIFRGLFAVLDIGKQVLSGVWAGIKVMLGAMGTGSGNVLDFAGSIGDVISSFNQWLHVGDKLKTFFETLGGVLAVPLSLIGDVTDALSKLFGGGDASGATNALSGMTDALKPAERAARLAEGAWQGLIKIMEKVGNFMQPMVDKIADTFGNLADTIANAISTNNFDPVFDVIQTALVGGIFLTIKKAIGGGLNVDLGGGALKKLSGSLDVLQGSLKSIQTNIKAQTMAIISAAVLALAVAVKTLSTIDPKRLTSAMSAVAVGLGELMGAMALLTKIGGANAFVTMPIIAGSLVILATAMDILSIAVMALSRLSWDEIGRGLAGLGGMLLGISAAAVPLSAAGPGMIAAGAAMIPLALGLDLLTVSMKVFATMKWEEIGKGLAGMAGALVAIGVAVRAIPPSVLLIGPGLVILGLALTGIAGAIRVFALMDLKTMAKGIGGIAAALVTIGVAMNLMPPTLPITAAALILVAAGLTGVAGAVALMGGQDVSTIAKGIIGIGAALVVLAVGLTLMIASLPGAAALLVAAGALAILVPLIGILGKMSFKTVAKGLGYMVGAIVALGVAGVIAAPGILALGAALAILGVGLTLVSAAVYLLVSGLTKLAGEGAKGVGVTIAAFTALIAVLPKIIINFIKGLVQVVEEIAKVAPKVVDAMVKIVKSLTQVLIKSSPDMAKAAIALITAILKVLNEKAPDIIKAGWGLLRALLTGISKNITKVTKTVADIVTKFLKALASKLPQLTKAGADVLVAFLKGISQNIGRVVKAAGNIMAQFIRGLGTVARRLISAGVKVITDILRGVGSGIPKVIRMGTRVITNFIKAIGNSGARIVTAGVNAATKFVNALSRQIPRLVDNVATAIIKMLNRLASVIRKREPEFIGALANVGDAIVDGILEGVTGIGQKLLDKVKDDIKSLPKKALSGLKSLISSVKLGLPDGLGTAFGVTFTNEVLEELKWFEDGFQRDLAKIGGAENISFLYNLGSEMSNTFMDGLLEGMDRPETEPLRKLQEIGFAFSNQLASSRGDIENIILDSTKKIRAANAKLDQIDKARDKAKKIDDKKKRTARLESLKRDEDAQNKIVKQEGKRIDQQEQLLTAIKNTSDFINNDTSYGVLLDKLVKAKDKVKALNDELEVQTSKLDELKSARESLVTSTFETFSAFPGIVTEDAEGNPIDLETQINNYLAAVAQAPNVLSVFNKSMEKLAGLGINSETYRQLLDIGPAAQGFVDKLISLGPDTIGAINRAAGSLKTQAQILADHAGAAMYDAAIQTWQGYVDGTNAKIKDAVDAADNVAREVITAVKKRLRQKSPSRVFLEIGKYSVEGMALGFANSSKLVTSAAASVGDDAVSAMKKSIRGIAEAVSSEIDPNPTITPILDLSKIQNGSKSLQDLLTGVSATASFGQAASISSAQSAAKAAEEAAATPSVIKFEQNNYSPEALSPIEIYRQTKNLVSQARPVLAT